MSEQTSEQQVREALAEVYRPEGIEIWLQSPAPFLGGEKPIDAINRGDGARCLQMIEALATGAFW